MYCFESKMGIFPALECRWNGKRIQVALMSSFFIFCTKIPLHLIGRGFLVPQNFDIVLQFDDLASFRFSLTPFFETLKRKCNLLFSFRSLKCSRILSKVFLLVHCLSPIFLYMNKSPSPAFYSVY